MPRDKDRYSKDQRYEIILDNGETPSKWSDLLGNVANVASGSYHVTGARSISFDKTSGVSRDAYIVRPLDQMNGVDLDPFSSEGQILTSVYLSSITDVDSYNVALLMSSGTDNGAFYSVSDSDLAVGWNHLKLDCNDYTTASGCGVDWHGVKFLAVGVSFDGADDTLSDILVDSVRLQVPTAHFNFDPNIDNLTINATQEVQLKSGDDADELSVDAANTARTTATNVIPVQFVDSTGKVSPAGECVGNSGFVKLTDGTNIAGMDAANTARTTGTIVQTIQQVDATGKVPPAGDAVGNSPFFKITDGTDSIDLLRADAGGDQRATITVPVRVIDTGGLGFSVLSRSSLAEEPSISQDALVVYDIAGGTASVTSVYRATTNGSYDGTVVYASGSTLTLTGTPFTVNSEDIVYVREIDAVGTVSNIWVNGAAGVYFSISGSTVTKAGGEDFDSDGVYELGYNGQDKAYSSALDAYQVSVVNPDVDNYSFETVADVTDEADASSDYYISVAGYRNVIVQFRKVGGTDTLTFTLHGTVEPVTAAASCHYEDITQYGTTCVTAAAAASFTGDVILKLKAGAMYRYIKCNVASSDSSDDGDYQIFVSKWN